MNRTFILIPLLFSLLFSGTIKGFSVSGNRRTKESRILDITHLVQGKTYNDSILNEAKNNLMKSGIFANASVTDSLDTIYIKVDEKWTIIPYFNISGSSELLSLQIGLYDANFLGSYSNLGGEYSYFYKTHNGSVYYAINELGKKHISSTTNIYIKKGVNNWYNEKGECIGGFINNKVGGSSYIEVPLKENRAYLGGELSLFNENYLDHLNELDYREVNDSNGLSFSKDAFTISPTILFKYTNFKYGVFTYEGWGVKTYLYHSFVTDKSSFTAATLNFQWYKLLPLQSNVCLNIRMSGNNGNETNSLYYIGGLNAVRGFNNGAFRGHFYSQGNIEYRIPSLHTKWVVFQHTFFADIATILDDSKGGSEFTTIYGTGLGLRILSPKIYSFMIKLDYAWGFGPYTHNQFYFGTTHFFVPF